MPRSLTRALTFVVAAVAVLAVLASTVPVAADPGRELTPSSSSTVPPASTTSTSSTTSTTLLSPPTTQRPHPQSPTTTTLPPASHTPPPAAAPTPLIALVPPRPAPNPVSVSIAASGDDPTGRLGLLNVAVGVATGELASARTSLEGATAAAQRARVSLDSAKVAATEADAAATEAGVAADGARQVLLTAATEAYIATRSTPHPTDQVAVYGVVDQDMLFAHGLRASFTPGAAKRAERLASAAEEASDSAAAAAIALRDAQRRLSAATGKVDRLTGRVAELEVELFDVASRRATVAAEVEALVAAAGAEVGVTRSAALDIPARTLDGYLLAAQRARVEVPACRMQWWVLAGIGAVETGHGTFRGAYPSDDGVVRPAILGPRLDGGSFARIGDTDGGALDSDTEFDRAVGPMQFIPSTWASSGRDGDGDGVADPHNIYDATYSAALYLCRGARGAAVDTPEGFAAAAWSYNRSRAYGAQTWQRATGYSAFAPRVAGGLSDRPA